MDNDLVAKASVSIKAKADKVWNALIDPEAIKQYMFGTDVITDWKEGNRIIWKGEWQGRPYEDKGVVLKFKPRRTIQYSHFSPLSGLPDKPENYHIVTIELSEDDNQTRVTLSQDKNLTEQEREHSEKNWGMMLNAVKELVEK